MRRPRVVVLSDFFEPAVRAGGPVRSLAALVRAPLDLELLVLTGDHDLGEEHPLPGVVVGEPVRVGHATVVRLPSRRPGSVLAAWRLLRRARPDCVYLNSLFAPVSGLLPLVLHRVRLLHAGDLVVAPRGQLDPGALGLHPRRKSLALHLVRRLGRRPDVRWHATSDLEAAHVRAVLGDAARITVLPPAPPVRLRRAPFRPPAVPLRLVYLSRVTPKKGLTTALSALAELQVPVELDVHGPEDDPAYSAACRRLAAALPSRHVVRFRGPLAHEQVPDVLEQADGLVLPTLGENFGHVLLEALAAGCPLVVGSQTPWTQVVRDGAGWVVDVGDPGTITAALEELATVPGAAQARSRAAVAAAREHCSRAADESGASWTVLFTSSSTGR